LEIKQISHFAHVVMRCASALFNNYHMKTIVGYNLNHSAH